MFNNRYEIIINAFIKNGISIDTYIIHDNFIKLHNKSMCYTDYENDWYKEIESNNKDIFFMSGGFITLGNFKHIKIHEGMFGGRTRYLPFDKNELINLIKSKGIKEHK